MSMTPWNGNVEQALKWMHSNAPNIQLLIKQKATWLQNFHTNFWDGWKSSVFDLRTAGPFGLMVWCIILGVPSQLFGLQSTAQAWAYGPNRQNYKYSGADPSLPVDKQSPGGNFYGGGATTLLNLDEVRWVLMLRYAALVGNGRIEYINRMLSFIFNNGEPWDWNSGRYFYVRDCTSATPSTALANVQVFMDDWQGNQLQYTVNRVNNFQYSEDFSQTYWGKTRATISMAAGVAPDGTNTAMRLVEDTTANNTHYFSRNVTAVLGTTITMTLFLKADQCKGIAFNLPDAQFGVGSQCSFDLVNGKAYVDRGSAVITKMKEAGWWRCDWTIDAIAAGTALWSAQLCREIPTSTNSSHFVYTGDGASGLLVWGAQYMTTSTPSNYIKSPGAASTGRIDYTRSTATVTFTNAPLTGAVISWSGNYGPSAVIGRQIGTGDGANKVFTLAVTNRPTAVPAAFRLEYQVGQQMGLSSQFINLLNDAQYGIMPSAAGSQVIVNQES